MCHTFPYGIPRYLAKGLASLRPEGAGGAESLCSTLFLSLFERFVSGLFLALQNSCPTGWLKFLSLNSTSFFLLIPLSKYEAYRKSWMCTYGAQQTLSLEQTSLESQLCAFHPQMWSQVMGSCASISITVFLAPCCL